MKYLILIGFMLPLFCSSLEAQGLSFQYIEAGEVSGSCTSLSDSTTNVQCYAIRYSPSATGTLTSYTLGFVGSCDSGSLPFLLTGSQSCIMADNTNSIDACATNQLFLLQPSGNNGNISVTQGLEITIHQVCFDVPLGDTIVLNSDGGGGLTFAITGPGGEPIDDTPSYVPAELVNEFSCEESTLCSIDFGLDKGRVDFTTNANGNIVDASSLANSFATAQGFDVYDESTMSCITSGGSDDIFFEFQLLNTSDINGNGIIDNLAGPSHRLIQTNDGLVADIPFNTDGFSQSSAGDIRGYSIEVTFANHIGVIADQILVHLEGVNSANSAFESASIEFFDQNYQPYGTVTHSGYYGGENDLSGNCEFRPAENTYTSSGTGIVLFQDSVATDVTLPCSPGIGLNGDFDSLSVSPRIHGGLDSAAVISGFRLIVLGEDVASPNMLDDDQRSYH